MQAGPLYSSIHYSSGGLSSSENPPHRRFYQIIVACDDNEQLYPIFHIQREPKQMVRTYTLRVFFSTPPICNGATYNILDHQKAGACTLC